ncbi:hypothetical protein JAAARDRAFT_663999 [Jaapia argillacea MUCL 33604]|uniref:Uncharacterized protein n=1 Tax=Jaapia argillacea MUCL 33604 TaxID=933084 RepID=A0A067P5S5_9AGAM|nr:hypothetical protein JAAARDRAFT_663999 [Jaapia argillacea MUCL 33604]
MAAVHGPAIASHPSPFRHGHSMARSSIPQVKVNPSISNAVASSSAQPISSSSASKTSQDPYYGHEHTARMCARFVALLFACPDLPTPPPRRRRLRCSLPLPSPASSLTPSIEPDYTHPLRSPRYIFYSA